MVEGKRGFEKFGSGEIFLLGLFIEMIKRKRASLFLCLCNMVLGETSSVCNVLALAKQVFRFNAKGLSQPQDDR